MVAHELKPQGRTKSLDSKAKGTMCAEPVISNGPASMPPSPVSRTNSRSYPFVPPTRQSLDTNQRCQTFQHGPLIAICRPDREAIAVRLLPAMLKEKVGSSHKHQPGLPKRPELPTYETVLLCIPYQEANWLVYIS